MCHQLLPLRVRVGRKFESSAKVGLEHRHLGCGIQVTQAAAYLAMPQRLPQPSYFRKASSYRVCSACSRERMSGQADQ